MGVIGKPLYPHFYKVDNASREILVYDEHGGIRSCDMRQAGYITAKETVAYFERGYRYVNAYTGCPIKVSYMCLGLTVKLFLEDDISWQIISRKEQP